MDFLYIGHYDAGSTSAMRGEYLNEILQPRYYKVANIDIPLKKTHRFFRSVGWKFKIGPFIKNINNYILSIIDHKWDYDLVWVDKGVFVNPEIVKKLKQHSKKLVHFTPDPAFTYHQSKLFYRALPYYDHCITTKSFEAVAYKAMGAKDLIFCTQGFKPEVHRPYHAFEDKKGIVFIGHREKDREFILAQLLKKYRVTLAGIGWERFAYKYRNEKNLFYKGNGIFGEEYARALSEALISLGLLSRIIPEMHTTRTFEIPACGTALVTEGNQETHKIFSENEAIFYHNHKELFQKIDQLYDNKPELQKITIQGMNKVRNGGYDYKSILENVLKQIKL